MATPDFSMLISSCGSTRAMLHRTAALLQTYAHSDRRTCRYGSTAWLGSDRKRPWRSRLFRLPEIFREQGTLLKPGTRCPSLACLRGSRDVPVPASTSTADSQRNYSYPAAPIKLCDAVTLAVLFRVRFRFLNLHRLALFANARLVCAVLWSTERTPRWHALCMLLLGDTILWGIKVSPRWHALCMLLLSSTILWGIEVSPSRYALRRLLLRVARRTNTTRGRIVFAGLRPSLCLCVRLCAV